MLKEMKKQNQGITLVALVVTIIVLIILAGVSINLILGENGIITKAQEAAEKNKAAVVKEELELWKANREIDKYSSNSTEENLEEVLTRLETEGKITSEQKEALLNGENITIGDVSISVCIYEAGEKVDDLKNTLGEVIGELISDGNGGEIPVPTSFYYVGGTVDNGAVISDNVNDQCKYKGEIDVETNLEGNQFVWIPCGTTTGESGVIAYMQDTSYNTGDNAKQNAYKDYTDWKDESNANFESITTYGGFFVGRYEAGIPAEAEFYTNSDGGTYYISGTTPSKNVDTYVPVSKAKTQSWNCISQINAKTVSSKMYNNSFNVTSSLIDSYAWDTIINWMESAGTDVLNSTNYGNYRNSTITVSDTLYAKHIWVLSKSTGNVSKTTYSSVYSKGDIMLGRELITDITQLPTGYDTDAYSYYFYKEISTGSSETTKVKNIYDMAGNMWEWTTEEGNHTTSDGTAKTDTYAVIRGAGFNTDGDSYPIIFRDGVRSTNYKDGLTIGFRVVLYII